MADRLPRQLLIDRDLSWLEFNRRVLAEAEDPRTPLLERLKFLAIFNSNLDEFFMKRIAVLRLRAGDRSRAASPSILGQLRDVIVPMITAQQACLRETLAQLEGHGVRILRWQDLTPAQRDLASAHFERNVSPALTPQAVDLTHPIPFVSNLSTSWACGLEDPLTGEALYGRVKVPGSLPAWYRVEQGVPAGEHWFLSATELVHAHLHRLFHGLALRHTTLFRITRDAEVELEFDEDVQAASLREMVAEKVRLRRYEPVVRIEFGEPVDPEFRALLLRNLELVESEVWAMPGPFDLTTLFGLAALDLPELRDPPWQPLLPPLLRDLEEPIFATLAKGDLLVHHPYESFDASVERFIREASIDPAVLGVKMTVYRIGDDTPFVRSLVRAAEGGKQVACVIELQARFDEARNLVWAEELAKAGAYTAYGVMGLKTHAKVAFVVRRENDSLRCYCHIGTGNYHFRTARLYTDLGLFTCDETIVGDVVQLFHYLTGRAHQPHFERLLVAPWNMRTRFLELIEREIGNQRAGLPARIVAKMNQLEDPEICAALVEASQAGLPVDLIVRGFCTLRPGVPGHTENLRVRSIVGRFLEHSRIFHFANGEADPRRGEFYIGSADWMSRNLSHRVEVVVPVSAPALRERLWEIIEIGLTDRRQAWELRADGSYERLQPSGNASGAELEGTHRTLMALTRARQEL